MNKVFLMLLAACIIGTGFFLAGNLQADSVRPDCPGTITCPVTGETICKDACPETNANAEMITCPLTGETMSASDCPEQSKDCPGFITCPKTGEEICPKLCPVK